MSDELKPSVQVTDISALPKNYDSTATEAKWRAEWQRTGIYQRNLSAKRERTFSVDSPPPTVSGSLHMGHVFSYTHQDVVARYKRMCGWNICYPMGWDDNGLPTERRVQNYFNVRAEPGAPFDASLKVEAHTAPTSSRAAVEPARVISRQNFIELCHTVTAQDEVAFRELFQRLGLSIDWREEYATIDDRCRRIAQRSFLDLHGKGHVYQLEAPTMWDTDFQTAVAQAEVEDREKSGAFHHIEFGVEGGGKFVIATTRPELLAACVGVAAHPDDPRYKELFGKNAVTPVFFARVPIFASSTVDPAKGTGILMVCTFGDQTDVEWWRSEKLALRQIVGRDGRVMPRTFGAQGWESLITTQANSNYAALVGKRLPSARSAVVEMLRNALNSAQVALGAGKPAVGTQHSAPLQTEPIAVLHSVRYYEKGESPLEYLTTRQWFVRLTDKKDRLLEMGRRIEWRPDFMRKRYENWVENLNVDWCVSRQRYFGVPIPVWYPLDAHGIADYSKPIFARPDQLPIDPMSQPPTGFSEHQRNKPGGFAGEPDVFDTWFTSSLSPQIVARWGDPDEQMAGLFPMDIRPQAHEIIRTWAFYTIAKSMLHHNEVPWRNIVISGWILDPDRKKMSKSKGNVVTPGHLLDQYGADSVRYWAASARLGMDTAYDEQVFKVGKRLVTKLFNAGKFVLQQTAGTATGAGATSHIVNELDRAFIGEMREVVRRATEAFEQFEFAQALEVTESFFWSGFTDNYIELVKTRARSETDAAGRASAVATLRLAMDTFLRLFAPFVPSICDEVWSWAFAAETGTTSIHTAKWPGDAELSRVEKPQYSDAFKAACDAIAAVRKAKTDAGLSIAAPVQNIVVTTDKYDPSILGAVLSDIAGAASASVEAITIVRGHNSSAEPVKAVISSPV